MTFFLPKISDKTPAGRLTRMPTIVDAAAIRPMMDSFPPRSLAKRGSTGLLEIVEEKMAKKPMAQTALKGENNGLAVLSIKRK
jgi:hypothetical protein